MDTRADFQRLLEDMDKAIETKRQELSELDERLESARAQLSEKEAQEILGDQSNPAIVDGQQQQQQEQQQLLITQTGTGERQTMISRGRLIGANRPLVDEYLQEQGKLYEQQLERFGEELAEFEIINQELVAKNEKLGGQLAHCLNELEKSKVNALSMNENLEELQSANLELNLRLAKAESELIRNQKLLKKTNQQDEVLMYALNDKLEALKRAIELRDEEIKRLKQTDKQAEFALDSTDIEQMKGLLSNQNIGGQSDLINLDKRKQVIELVRAFKEKDEQIQLLKSQLLQAAKDLEQNANLLEMEKERSLQHQLEQDRRHHHQMESANQNDKRDERFAQVDEELLSKYQLAENELEAKDRQLHLAEFRVHYYETILPNMISDLVRKLATTSAQLTSDWLLSKVENGKRVKMNDDEEDSIKSLMEELAASLSRLPGELSAARALLDNIDQLRGLNELKEAQIERLVDELNQLDVKFNLVQQQCDLLQQQQQHQQLQRATNLPNSTESASQISGLESEQKAAGDPLNSSQYVNGRQEDQRAAGGSSLGCQVLSSGKSLRATSEGHNKAWQCDKAMELHSASGAPLPSKLVRATQSSFEQQDDGHQSAVSAGGKRSISGQQVTFTGTAALDQQQQSLLSPERALNGTAQVALNSNGQGNELAIGNNNDAASKEVPKMLFERNNGQLKQICKPMQDDSLAPMQKRLKQLESENELLELAMKEILLSIKWSDAQCSTILIDCPSLERLCQLIEARFLAKAVAVGGQEVNLAASVASKSEGAEATSSVNSTVNNKHLFQLIVLKSELDLLRGQNEQLRADVKIYRRELLTLSAHLEQNKTKSKPDKSNSPLIIKTKTNEELMGDKSMNEVETTNQRALCQEQHVQQGSEGRVELSSRIIVAASGQFANEDKLEVSVDGINNNKGSSNNKIGGNSLEVATSDKCSNCDRLTNLISHLFKCIVRVENRVNMSEETYIGRLLSLSHLIQTLERDLSAREFLLNKSQRECQLMAKQKLSSETRLQFVETELSFHLRTCPMMSNDSTSVNLFHPSIVHHNKCNEQPQTSKPATCFINAGNRLQVYTATTAQSGLGESIQSLTSISRNSNHHQQVEHLPTMRSARLTISLLQSIIGCLQARLDYKDERLRNLESLVASESGTNGLVETSGGDLSNNQQTIIKV